MKDQKIIDYFKKQKDSQAFRLLLDYFPQVESFIKAQGGSKADAEDLFQEALIIFYRKLRQNEFTLQAKISTFLIAIVKYQYWELRKKAVRQQKQVAAWKAEETVLLEDIETLVEKEQNYLRAESAFQKLGKKCQRLLNLFYLKQSSMEDIAKKLGLRSAKVAKNQKYKCLKQAQVHYQKREEA